MESCIPNRYLSSRPNRDVLYLTSSIVQHNPTISQFTIECPEIPHTATVATSDIRFRNVVTTFTNSLGDSCNANVDGIDEDKDNGDVIVVLGCCEYTIPE